MTQPSLFDLELPPELKGVHLLVASILLDNRGDWVKSGKIAKRLGIGDAADVRHIIQELIDDYKLELIGDRLKGFRFSENRQEFEDHQAPNVKQALTTLARVRARLGERRFKGLVARLKVREGLDLVEGITGA